MTKSKKRSSLFYQEQDSLFETSDMQPVTKKKPKLKSALEAEQHSKKTVKKIVKKHTPVDEIKSEDEGKLVTSRNERLDT
ncbi:MAG: hypothetical protein Q8O99_07900 [bacterium]|nr:hypothetical protein [bacterium]